jgi:hypothetical protein
MIPIPPGLAAVGAKAGVKTAIRIATWVVPLLILLGIAIWIAMLKADVRSLTKQRDQLRGWQTNIVNVVKAEVPPERRKAVTPSEAANDIRWLGREYRTHRDALERQSAALRTAAATATEARNAAAEARKRAKDANSGLRAIQDALNAPGRSEGLKEAEWGKL